MIILRKRAVALVPPSNDPRDEGAAEWLVRYLTVPPKSNHPDAYPVKLARKSRLGVRFGAGLTGAVRKAAIAAGYPCTVVDERGDGPQQDPEVELDWLRDYQLDAVAAAISGVNGMLWLPTGSGKTEIAVGLTLAVPTPWLFVVHRGQLADQAAERYRLRTGERAVRFRPGRRWDPETPFTVATFQSLWRNRAKPSVKELFATVGGLIVDEAHTVGARTHTKVAMACKNAYYRIGLSGTPFARTDDRNPVVMAVLGPTLHHVEAGTLIGDGFVAKPKILAVKHHQKVGKSASYDKLYEAAIVKSASRNALVVDLAKKCERPCLVFVKRVDHALSLVERLREVGVTSSVVTGRDSDESRNRKIRHLETGEIEVLVATVVFQEGVDIPALQTVIVAAGGASTIAAIQRVGRAMRTGGGKRECTVYDIFDDGHSILRRHSVERVKAYRREGYEVSSMKGGG